MDVQQQRAEDHPLYKPLMAAIHQAMFGKGVRHGGATVPWLEQPIFHYAKMHGRGFLTGQAAKKLEEAANTRNGEAFVTEVLGAIVYCGAALIREQQDVQGTENKPISFDREWPWTKAPEPLAKLDLSRAQRQQQQGHDGPGGVILRNSNPTREGTAPWRDPAGWARYQEQRNTGRYGGGRFDLPPPPPASMDAEVFASRDQRNCDSCMHRNLDADQFPCSCCGAETTPSFRHWEPPARQG